MVIFRIMLYVARALRTVTIADRRIGGSAADRRFADRRSCNEYYRSPVAIVRLEYFSAARQVESWAA